MINAIIIEDERNVSEALKKMLKLVSAEVHLVKEFTNVKESVAFLSTNKIDLVFLDIELEDGTGFDILEQLNFMNFKIIFTTAYNQYAIKAFKYSTIDYLLKPIDPLELQNAIKRTVLDLKQQQKYFELLKVLKYNISEKEQKIVIKTTEEMHIIKINNVIHLKAEGAYTIFFLLNKKIIASKNIKYFQEILGETFIRCHQSHLVNSKHILSLSKNFLKMSNNDLIPISTRKKSDIKMLLKNK